jgi:predicted Zn-dependent protease
MMGVMHRWCVLGLLATGIAAQSTGPGRGVNFYSLEKEQALGAQLAAEYRRNVRGIDSAGVSAYVNEMGQRIAGKAGGAAYAYTFELVDDDRMFLQEPVAFPGGPVFVPVGLILAAQNEGELAGMMAHAIAHIAARHGTKAATKTELVNQASIPLIFMGGWTGYAIRQGQALAIPLGFVKFARQGELEADALAVAAMAAAGYDPAGLASYVERVQPVDALPPKLTSPIPDRDARLAAMRAAIQALPAASYAAHDGFAAIQEAAKAAPRLAR